MTRQFAQNQKTMQPSVKRRIETSGLEWASLSYRSTLPVILTGLCPAKEGLKRGKTVEHFNNIDPPLLS